MALQVRKMVDKVLPAEILEAPWEEDEANPSRSTRQVLIEGYVQHYEDLFTFHDLDVCAAQVSLPPGLLPSSGCPCAAIHSSLPSVALYYIATRSPFLALFRLVAALLNCLPSPRCEAWWRAAYCQFKLHADAGMPFQTAESPRRDCATTKACLTRPCPLIRRWARKLY